MYIINSSTLNQGILLQVAAFVFDVETTNECNVINVVTLNNCSTLNNSQVKKHVLGSENELALITACGVCGHFNVHGYSMY